MSGNPAVRAEQLAEERPLAGDEPDALLNTLGLGPDGPEEAETAIESLLGLARTMAGDADPADWWPKSHERVLERARAVDWPSDLAGIEEMTCSIIGEQLRDNFAEHHGGHHTTPWLRALAEHAGTALQAALASGADDDWKPLWALLRGLVLTAPLSSADPETKDTFPDIKFPHEVALAEAGKAAGALASRGLLQEGPAGGWPVPDAQPAGTPLIARDSYGSRFLLAAPFGYREGEADHWYAWDVDACWMTTVVAAGTFGSQAEALAEWREAVGVPGAGSEFSPCEPEMATKLLDPSLTSNALMDMPQGGEPESLLREYYRNRRRAQALASAGLAAGPEDGRSWRDGYAERSRKIRNEFRKWHAERYGKRVAEVSQGAETIIGEWGPSELVGEPSFYGCSPHRVEYAAHLISDGYLEDYAARAIRLLPDWVQWCAERSGIDGEAAERALATARAAAELAADKGPDAIPDPAAENGMLRRAE